MNKLFLLTAASALCLATGAQAQQLRQHTLVAAGNEHQAVRTVRQSDASLYAGPAGSPTVLRNGTAQAKGAGATFYSQTFGSGIPSGWTVASTGGAVGNGWRYATTTPSGTLNQYYISAIRSTTAANGWLLYNADSVKSTSAAFGGTITSAPISCSGHSAVSVSFQQYFRRGGLSTGGETDSCFVDVSTNGTTFTSFPVYPNNTISQYQYLYTNPAYATINISSVAANQPNVYIRFRYSSIATTYAFNWLIDDVAVFDTDPVDIGLARSGGVSQSTSVNGFSDNYSFSAIPVQFADTVFPISFVSNFGNTAAASVTVNASYYNGTTQVGSTQNTTFTNAKINGYDSTVIFNTGFKPTATGNYTIAINVNQSGDAVAANNADSIRFAVTDSIYASYGNTTSGGWYINRTGTSGFADYRGARFTIPAGKKDTVTSASAAIFPITGSAGQKVQIQIYKAQDDGAGGFYWNFVAKTATRTLTTADVTAPASGINFVSMPMLITNKNFSPLILADGDYAAVLTTVSATADVAVYTTIPPFAKAPSYIGYQGQDDDSPNDGTNGFGAAVGTGIRTGTIDVPAVRANFGDSKALVTTGSGNVGVTTTSGIELIDAYPNPANTAFYLPIIVNADAANVTVTLSNIIGQPVLVEKVGALTAGQPKTVKINTADLAQGTYFYTVEANGERMTSKVTVTH